MNFKIAMFTVDDIMIPTSASVASAAVLITELDMVETKPLAGIGAAL